MRIISGRFRGRRFDPPAKNWPTRPTTDISKEGLFNILQNRLDFEDTKFLDLFGGTGNHCFEMISRGCQDATYVDKHFPAIKFVKRLSGELEIEPHLQIVRSDVAKYIKACAIQYDYIFAGPPYGLNWLDEIPNMIFEFELLKDEGLFVLEHNPNHDFKEHKRFSEMRNYGQTIFSFFK